MNALIYFLIWAALIFLMMRFGCGAHVMGHGRRHRTGHNTRDGPIRWVAPESDIDPVCGKSVRTANAKSAVHDGTVYYFCSRDCREQFEAAPEIYVTTGLRPKPKALEERHGTS